MHLSSGRCWQFSCTSLCLQTSRSIICKVHIDKSLLWVRGASIRHPTTASTFFLGYYHPFSCCSNISCTNKSRGIISDGQEHKQHFKKMYLLAISFPLAVGWFYEVKTASFLGFVFISLFTQSQSGISQFFFYQPLNEP